MMEKNLEDLIEEYEEATKIYDELNERVNNLFREREEKLDLASKPHEIENILDFLNDDIYNDALPDRNQQANIVSMLYFVISMK